MRNRLALVTLATLGACGDMSSASVTTMSDASPADAAVEDLAMSLADFANIQGYMTPTGRRYRVANPLGHEAEALAAASSPTGGSFPVGSIVAAQPNLRTPGAPTVKVVVTTEFGRNATAEEDATVAYVMLTDKGKVASTRRPTIGSSSASRWPRMARRRKASTSGAPSRPRASSAIRWSPR